MKSVQEGVKERGKECRVNSGTTTKQRRQAPNIGSKWEAEERCRWSHRTECTIRKVQPEEVEDRAKEGKDLIHGWRKEEIRFPSKGRPTGLLQTPQALPGSWEARMKREDWGVQLKQVLNANGRLGEKNRLPLWVSYEVARSRTKN